MSNVILDQIPFYGRVYASSLAANMLMLSVVNNGYYMEKLALIIRPSGVVLDDMGKRQTIVENLKPCRYASLSLKQS